MFKKKRPFNHIFGRDRILRAWYRGIKNAGPRKRAQGRAYIVHVICNVRLKCRTKSFWIPLSAGQTLSRNEKTAHKVTEHNWKHTREQLKLSQNHVQFSVGTLWWLTPVLLLLDSSSHRSEDWWIWFLGTSDLQGTRWEFHQPSP